MTDRWVANRARSVVNRSIPPVFSSSGGQHRHAADHQDHAPGHRRSTGRFSSASLRQGQDHRDGERPHPDVHPEADHADDQDAIAARVTQCLECHRGWVRRWRSRHRSGRRRGVWPNSRQPPKTR